MPAYAHASSYHHSLARAYEREAEIAKGRERGEDSLVHTFRFAQRPVKSLPLNISARAQKKEKDGRTCKVHARVHAHSVLASLEREREREREREVKIERASMRARVRGRA